MFSESVSMAEDLILISVSATLGNFCNFSKPWFLYLQNSATNSIYPTGLLEGKNEMTRIGLAHLSSKLSITT